MNKREEKLKESSLDLKMRVKADRRQDKKLELHLTAKMIREEIIAKIGLPPLMLGLKNSTTNKEGGRTYTLYLQDNTGKVSPHE